MKKGLFMKKLMAIVFTLAIIICGMPVIKIKAALMPTLTYCGHVQDYGWQGLVKNGETAGSTGNSKRLEGVKIYLTDEYGNSIVTYRTHVQDEGWQSWKSSGKVAGTTGKLKRLEAIQIKLNGNYANQYDICYRVHVGGKGWLEWTKNGETAGSTGIGGRVEALQIKLVSKNSMSVNSSKAVLSKPSLTYKSHVGGVGWQGNVGENGVSGTTGQSRRLEALIISLKDFDGNNGVEYKAHVEGVGWQGWQASGQLAGTTGQAKSIEAVQIILTNILSNFFDVHYRAYIQNKGWLGWAKNGEVAGSTGCSLRMEAIQIKLVIKGGSSSMDSSSAASISAQSSYSVSNNVLTINGISLTEYKIGSKCSNTYYSNINGKSTYLGGSQCLGYARYVQRKLYGYDEFNDGGKYTDISGVISYKNVTADKIKSLVNSAGVGGHIRTSNNNGTNYHSLVIIGISADGFTITDGNSDGRLTVRYKKFKWQEYVNTYGKRGINSIKKYNG